MSMRWKNPRYTVMKKPGEEPAPKEGDTLVSKSRIEAKNVLAQRSDAPSPGGNEKPEGPRSRSDLIDAIRLESQFDERMDSLFEFINRGIFVMGTPELTREAVLKTFTTDQLRLALEYREPTLLLVPKTSFEAKGAALDAAVTIFQEGVARTLLYEGCLSDDEKKRAEEIAQWKSADIPCDEGLFSQEDSGSGRIEGWRALIVEGQGVWNPTYKEYWTEWNMYFGGSKENIDIRLMRQKCRKPGEAGMDRHVYAMLMLNGLLKGEPIDVGGDGKGKKYQFTALDDDSANSKYSAPTGRWSSQFKQVVFGTCVPVFRRDMRFRRSVGGEVRL
jgi:hypothetical protein